MKPGHILHVPCLMFLVDLYGGVYCVVLDSIAWKSHLLASSFYHCEVTSLKSPPFRTYSLPALRNEDPLSYIELPSVAVVLMVKSPSRSSASHRLLFAFTSQLAPSVESGQELVLVGTHLRTSEVLARTGLDLTWISLKLCNK